jgi:type IV pilus assembly protein PilC
MRFEYRAYAADDPRRQLSDVLDADTRAEAASMLRRNGFVPIEIKAVSERKFDPNNIQIGAKKVKIRENALFTRQLATMIAAGMSPVQSIEVVTHSLKNKFFKESLDQVKDSINTGSDLSGALGKHPRIFSALYISLIKAGEAGGIMPEALNRLADQMETDAQIRGEIKGALVYPAVVMTFAILILTAMLLFVVPAFATIFAESGGELPMLTQILVNMSNVVREFWFLLPVVPIAIRFLVKSFLNSDKGRTWWDQAKLKMPMKVGPLYQKVITARFARTLATLSSAGVPILESLEITGPTTNNVIVERGVQRISNDIKTGQDIAVSIRQAELFPDMAVAMISAGEEAGELGTMLSKVADTYEEEVSVAIKGLKSIMEPILMIFIGAVVGITVIALYLPIFKVYDQIS